MKDELSSINEEPAAFKDESAIMKEESPPRRVEPAAQV
jgi:hypothetical protein